MRKTVLIVDDLIDLRECLKDSFEGHSCNVLMAENGMQALQLTSEHKIDLIITDIDMPIMNGVEFLKAFRQINGVTPVIVVTGGARYTEREVLALGATAFAYKPLLEIDSFLKLIAY